MRIRPGSLGAVLAAAIAGCGGSPAVNLAGCTGAGCVTPPAGVCGDMQNDPQNCGACRNVCGTQACNAGSCGPAATSVLLAKVSPYMSGLALDGSFVYFADRSTAGGVYRAPIGGGAAVQLAADKTPHALALSSGSLLFGADPGSSSMVRKVPVAGGAVTDLAASSGSLLSIATDGSSAFWTTSYTDEVDQVPLAGGAPVQLSSGTAQVDFVAADSTNVYWIANGDIVSRPKSGGAISTLVSGMYAQILVLQGGSLYFSTWRGYNNSATGIYRVPVAGGTPSAIATGLFAVTTLATDGTTVYFADGLNDFSVLRKVPAAGGAKYVSLTGYVPTPLWSALDGSSVYWNDQRTIYRMAR